MIYSTKNQFAQLIESQRESDEEILIKIVENTWNQFNDFISSNLRMFMIYLKDIAYLNFRQKDSLTTLKLTMRQQQSISELEHEDLELDIGVKNNGLIFHDFNYPEYVNKQFAEDEVKQKRLIMVACEPDMIYSERDKVSVEKRHDENLTSYKQEMTKMRTIVKKAEMHKNEQIKGALEFRAQFTDLMKNINQSYTILKGGIVDNKKAKDEKEEKSSMIDESVLSSINLFKKLKVKKKFNISEVKPRVKLENRVPSAVVNPVCQPPESSYRRVSRLESRKHTESSIRYEDSDTGLKVNLRLSGSYFIDFCQIPQSRQAEIKRHSRQYEPYP